jgi:hypothetical protein
MQYAFGLMEQHSAVGCGVPSLICNMKHLMLMIISFLLKEAFHAEFAADAVWKQIGEF